MTWYNPKEEQMFKIIRNSLLPLLLLAVMAITGQASAATLINGAGATFPYPIYSKWFSEYAKIDPSVKFNYQSIGSGGGIKQIIARTVDFGASDKFLTDEQLKSAPGKILHIPTVMGAVVVTYNIPGIGKGLKLTPDVLADIYPRQGNQVERSANRIGQQGTKAPRRADHSRTPLRRQRDYRNLHRLPLQCQPGMEV